MHCPLHWTIIPPVNATDIDPNIALLHRVQLRTVVGFPSTWLEIHPPGLDFQPKVRNPTRGW